MSRRITHPLRRVRASVHIPIIAGAAAMIAAGASAGALVIETGTLPRAHAQVSAAPVAVARVSGKSTTKTASENSRPKRVTTVVRSKSAASIGTLETMVQTLNNCGPSSVAAVLAYWHVYRTQTQVQIALRADSSYWGMSPVHLPVYARSLGLRALVGYGGSEKLIKLLIANGFPVIASQYVSSSDPIRHYRPIEAYNDRTQTFESADPYLGAGHLISYSEFNAIWAESDRRFQVIYPASRQAQLNAILRASGWNASRTYSQAIRWEEAQMHTSDFQVTGSWIWYNAYPDIAFDEAQLGQFRKANAALAAATRQGISPVLIGWVRSEIQLLQHHG